MSLPDLFRRTWAEAAPLEANAEAWVKNMRREFDRLFDQMLPSARGLSDFLPRLNSSEDETAIHIEAELPGLSEKDVDVTLSDGLLTIRGERKQESEQKKRDYHTREWSYGSFVRSIRLPAEVDESKIAASFKNGVLTVDLPKSPEAKSKVKKIDVKAA